MFELANGGQVSIMNRLDRETSGIVLVAKHAAAASTLAKAQQGGEFTKIYRTIVRGWPEWDEWDIDAPICRKGEVSESEIYIRQTVDGGGAESLTKCRVISRLSKHGHQFAVLECELITGRTHQIRVHLEHAGYPVVGDKIYGHSGQAYLDFIEEGWTTELQKALILNRHALHATELKWRDFHWKSPLPDDLQEFLKK